MDPTALLKDARSRLALAEEVHRGQDTRVAMLLGHAISAMGEESKLTPDLLQTLDYIRQVLDLLGD